MKKTVILASVVALAMSCSHEDKKKDLEKSDVAGHTWTMKSGDIKGLKAEFAGDNALRFKDDNSFELFEKGDEGRSCTDGPAKSTMADEKLATGTWSFDAQKKELTVTIKGIAQYAIPFVSEENDSFTITDLQKGKVETTITGKISTLYDMAEADVCKTDASPKKMDGSSFKLSFTSSTNDQMAATILTPQDLYSSTAGSSWKATFTKSDGTGAIAKATFANDNVLTFLKGNAKKVVYLEAGTARTCTGAQAKGKRLFDKDAEAGNKEFDSVPTWNVDDAGNLTITILKANYSKIAYLLPFAMTPSSTADSLTITIKGCKISGDGTKITGKMDTIYDLKSDDAGTGVACTNLTDDGNLNAVSEVTVILTKGTYDEGMAKNEDLPENVIAGKTWKIKSVKDSSGTEIELNEFLKDNPIAFTKDTDGKISWTYGEGATTAYVPKCITADADSGAITKIESQLSRGTATFGGVEGDSTRVSLVLSIEKVTVEESDVSKNPYLVPFSDKDPTAASVAGATVTIKVPKVVTTTGSFEATMDYYMPQQGDEQCKDNDTTPAKKIAKALVGNATKKADAKVTLTMAATPSE